MVSLDRLDDFVTLWGIDATQEKWTLDDPATGGSQTVTKDEALSQLTALGFKDETATPDSENFWNDASDFIGERLKGAKSDLESGQLAPTELQALEDNYFAVYKSRGYSDADARKFAHAFASAHGELASKEVSAKGTILARVPQGEKTQQAMAKTAPTGHHPEQERIMAMAEEIKERQGVTQPLWRRALGQVEIVLSGQPETEVSPTPAASGAPSHGGDIASGLAKKAGGKIVGTAEDALKKKVVGEVEQKAVTTAAAGLVSGGVGWVIGAAQLILSSNFLKDVLSKASIAAAYAFAWLLAHPLAAGLMILGGATGAFLTWVPVIGPMMPLVSAGAGLSVGLMLENTFGMGAAAPTSAATISSGSAAGATSLGGAAGTGTLATSGLAIESTMTGLFTSLGGFFTATPVLMSVVGGIVGVSIGTYFVVTYVATASFMTPPQEGDWSKADGNLVAIQKTATPTSLTNDSNATIAYSVVITAKDTDVKIKVTDTVSLENTAGSKTLSFPTPPVFPTALTKGQSQKIDFTFPVTSAYNDANIVNVVTVVASADGQPDDTEIAQASTKIGAPVYTAGRCPLAPAGNPCYVETLLPYFGGDRTRAENASRICYKESGGKVNSLNDGCVDPKGKRYNEYSVGIFQINLYAHSNYCSEFGVPFPTKGNACIRNDDVVNACRQKMTSNNCPKGTNPSVTNDCNIWAAVDISRGGTTFKAWSTAKPQYCNIP